MLLIISIAQEVIIRIVPFSFFSFIIKKIGCGIFKFIQVKIALTNYFWQLWMLNSIGFLKQGFGSINCFLKFTGLKLNICHIIWNIVIKTFVVRNLIEVLVSFRIIVFLIGHIARIIFGLGTVFIWVKEFREIRSWLGKASYSEQGIAFFEIKIFLTV